MAEGRSECHRIEDITRKQNQLEEVEGRMMLRSNLWVLLMPVLVAGCGTATQADYVDLSNEAICMRYLYEPNRNQSARAEELKRRNEDCSQYRGRDPAMEKFRQMCDSFGFKRGTDAHANCMMSQKQKADAPYPSTPSKPTYTCRTTQYGGVNTTTCD